MGTGKRECKREKERATGKREKNGVRERKKIAR